jgi:hypothetical protein
LSEIEVLYSRGQGSLFRNGADETRYCDIQCWVGLNDDQRDPLLSRSLHCRVERKQRVPFPFVDYVPYQAFAPLCLLDTLGFQV